MFLLKSFDIVLYIGYRSLVRNNCFNSYKSLIFLSRTYFIIKPYV